MLRRPAAHLLRRLLLRPRRRPHLQRLRLLLLPALAGRLLLLLAAPVAAARLGRLLLVPPPPLAVPPLLPPPLPPLLPPSCGVRPGWVTRRSSRGSHAGSLKEPFPCRFLGCKRRGWALESCAHQPCSRARKRRREEGLATHSTAGAARRHPAQPLIQSLSPCFQRPCVEALHHKLLPYTEFG